MTGTPISVDAVRFVKELYPRLREDDAAVERYRAAIDKLPPIVIARDGVLVDGFHRWQAYRKENRTEIAAVNLGNLTDSEIIRESISRNATHGQQLSQADKRRMAGILWPTLNEKTRIAELVDLLSSSQRAVENWTKDARALEKAEKQARAWDLWLDCLSERSIATGMSVHHDTINEWVSDKRNSADFRQPPDSRQHFDVWQFATADGESSYFGKMPPQVVENLLWFYTEPGQTIVDPFAGGGTTIDVAKKMGRRVWASDRKPATPTLPIHEHDILTGWPADAPSKPDLVLLDPPYWQQAKGRYSDSDTDLGNMPLDTFYDAWSQVVKTVITKTSRVAYIISPTQLEDGTVIDHATDMLDPFLDNGWRVERRIIVPYSTQQATGQQVTWARDNKRMLKLYRDLVVLTP